MSTVKLYTLNSYSTEFYSSFTVLVFFFLNLEVEKKKKKSEMQPRMMISIASL